MLTVLNELLKAIGNNDPAALATVMDVKGASPAQTGFKILVLPEGGHVGNIGGGELERRVIAAARKSLVTGKCTIVHYSLKEEGADSIGMLCGGDVTVFIEPFTTRPTLMIVGGGHIGRPLAEMARIVGYDVKVVDARPERGEGPELDLSRITDNTYVVIITEDHVTDEQTLRKVLGTKASYIGMIGSLKKIGTILERMRKEGFKEEHLKRLRGPIGLDLGGREPQQIALAILAEIEIERNGGSGKPRSQALRIGPN